MAYRDFTLERATRTLGVTIREVELFGGVAPIEVPAWLRETLGKRTQLMLLSEKARSEFIVAPVLLTSRDLSPTPLSIYSGHRFDVDQARGLVGECDFILAASEPVPPLRAPIVTIVEAKRNDIELGLGQCIAQMVAAAQFNREAGDLGPVYGCVTTGEAWQFLRLDEPAALIDRRRYYLSDLPSILGVLQATIARLGAAPPG